MPMKFSLILFLSLIVVFVACHRSHQAGEKMSSPTPEVLMETNRYMAEKDNENIANYIKRHGWHMQRTGTGLWYEIVVHGTGAQVRKGDLVTLDYSVSLLDGSLCYSSGFSGPKQFIVGQGGVESGLEQGVLLLHKGDQARFIIPPWLAYGVPGDRKKIPPRSVVVYEVTLVGLN
jgi:FKBP-type peptidyl-prolyl cis-trans isomerase FkpA